jgi:hypothetical protein
VARLGYEGTTSVAVAHLDEALKLEHSKRLPNPGPADAELLG